MNKSLGVVVPCHNAEATIENTLDSIRQQSIDIAKVTVVDDGSTDDSSSVVRRFNVLYIFQENAGPSVARNLGMKNTETDYIAFLDADDQWTNRTLEKLALCLENERNAEAVQGRTQDFWPNAVPGEPRFTYNVSSALFRRSALLAAGGFDESLRSGEDVDLWIRWRAQERTLVQIEDTVLRYYRKADNRPDRRQQHYARVLQALKQNIRNAPKK